MSTAAHRCLGCQRKFDSTPSLAAHRPKCKLYKNRHSKTSQTLVDTGASSAAPGAIDDDIGDLLDGFKAGQAYALPDIGVATEVCYLYFAVCNSY